MRRKKCAFFPEFQAIIRQIRRLQKERTFTSCVGNVNNRSRKKK